MLRPTANAATSVSTISTAFASVGLSDSSSSRKIEKTSIRPIPTGKAAARHAFDISSAGVVMKRSSAAYSHAGQATIARNASDAQTQIASNSRRRSGACLDTSAAIRMCSPRRSAITAPSIASQMKSMDASSSDQTSGRWNTNRATTPASSTTMSASTRAPAHRSTTRPSPRSRRASGEAARDRAASSWRTSSPTPSTSGPAFMPACRPSARGWPRHRRRTCPSIRRRSRPCAADRETPRHPAG